MELEHELALRVLEAHPRETAQLVERLPVDAVGEFLAEVEPRRAARVLEQMAPYAAGRVLQEMDAQRASGVVGELPIDVGALFLRGLPEDVRGPILQALPSGRRHGFEVLLRFPEDTAGALMDPEVLALPEDLTAEDAVARVREAAHAARYNLYIVDRGQRLVGVINQRELLLAPRDATLASFMSRRVHRLGATTDRAGVASHPAWREVHSLPVVDARGVYLGAVRYRAFRAIEEGLRTEMPDPSLAAQALGDLFRTGASAVLEMLSASPAREGGSHDAR